MKNPNLRKKCEDYCFSLFRTYESKSTISYRAVSGNVQMMQRNFNPFLSLSSFVMRCVTSEKLDFQECPIIASFSQLSS